MTTECKQMLRGVFVMDKLFIDGTSFLCIVMITCLSVYIEISADYFLFHVESAPEKL